MSSKMWTHKWTKDGRAVFCLCEDNYLTGNIVYAEASPPISLRTTDGQSYPLIAGNESESGYAEGVRRAARFRWISSCLHLNKTSLLVVDSGNHCLRLVDRISHQTSPFVGSCTQVGYRDGDDPLFRSPQKVILDLMNNNQLLLLDRSNHVLRAINMQNMSASTLAMFNTSLQQKSFAQHTDGNVYVFESSSLFKYDYVTQTITLVAGSSHGTGELRDGPLLESQFGAPPMLDMIFLNSNDMLVTDMLNGKLRLVDLGWNMVFSICTGRKLYGVRSLTNCRLQNPRALLAVNNAIYVGCSHRIEFIQGRL